MGRDLLQWSEGRPELASMMFDAPPAQGSSLKEVLQKVVGIGPERIKGNEGLLSQKVAGDFVVRADASRGRIAEGLEPILVRVLRRPVSLRIEQTMQDVYVAMGEFQLSELARRRGQILMEGALVGTANSVEEAVRHKDQAPRDRLDGILSWMSRSIGVPIINKVESPPLKRIAFNSILGAHVRNSFRADPIVDSVSRQTGLTFSKENRRILTLRVEGSD